MDVRFQTPLSAVIGQQYGTPAVEHLFRPFRTSGLHRNCDLFEAGRHERTRDTVWDRDYWANGRLGK